MPFIWIAIWLIFLGLIIAAIAREARQTSWSLLESIIIVNGTGQTVALAILYVVRNNLMQDVDAREIAIGAGLLATLGACCVLLGAVWSLRRLKRIDELRTAVRLYYLISGMLLLPTVLFTAFVLMLISDYVLAGVAGVCLCVLLSYSLWRLNLRSLQADKRP